MTDSMIERVARSICRESGAICVIDEDPARPACTRKNCENISLARAAIQAMRTPTEAMCDATDGLDVYWAYTSDGRPGMPSDVWSTMIYAALEEKP